MSILDIFNNNQEKFIGRFEAKKDNATNTLLSMMNGMGMMPKSLVSKSNKGITITKKGNNYVFTLNMFVPPLEISWNEPLDYKAIEAFILKVVNERKKIACVNTIKSSNNTTLFQFGTN